MIRIAIKFFIEAIPSVCLFAKTVKIIRNNNLQDFNRVRHVI